jgi:uncharacterized protein
LRFVRGHGSEASAAKRENTDGIETVHLSFAVAALIGVVSLLYATAGQAGGTAFIAVMSFAGFPASELRPTALLLNIVAAGYATWRAHRKPTIETHLLLPLLLPSVVTAFIGGLLALNARAYFVLTGRFCQSSCQTARNEQ